MGIKSLLYGLGLGAGAMYLWDPERGNRRRALLRDQAIRLLNRTDETINKGTRDLGNRATGMIAEAKSRINGEETPDDVLVLRVRSKIGRVVSHPRALDVTAQDGRVTLRGPILAADVTPLMTRLASVRGVRGVDNQLEVHDEPGNVEGLQGEPVQTAAERAGDAWAPGIRLLAASGGVLLYLSSYRHRRIMGTLRRAMGAGLLARSITNRSFSRLIGTSGQGGAVPVRKGIKIDAPVHEVFAFWQNYDNFPRFMSNVLEVCDMDEGRSHWKVNGPAGTPVEWDAIVTNLVIDQVIAWESIPGSAVMQSGLVRFSPAEDGGTHLNVQMAYSPPAGIIGHAVASFFGVNPKQAMDQDLLRLKSLIERGETSAKGEKVTRQAVEGGRRSASQAAAQAKAYAQPARVSGDISGQASGGRGERPSSPDRTPATPEGTPTDVYAGPQTAAESRRDSGVPGGGAGRVDEVGETGVYPMSGSERPPDDAPVQGMASWGQGERGAEGYEDSGSSELTGLGEETDLGSVIPGQPDEPNPES